MIAEKEIKQQIRTLEKERAELHDRAMCSDSVDEVRECNKRLAEIRSEIFTFEDQLDNMDDVPENATLVNGDIRSAFRGGSFAVGRGCTVPENNTSKLTLRSDEALVSRLPMNERKNLDLGKTVRGLVTGNWTDALEERDSISTTSAGVLIPSVLSASLIDKARNLSLFTAAGVPIVPMQTNNLTIARVKTDPVFAFKEELAEATESSFELEPVELKAKTAYGYAYCSLEAIHSASNLNEILNQVFSQAFADMIDKAMLYGQDDSGQLATYAPSGIMNDASINAIVAENKGYKDFIKAIGAVRRGNGIPTVCAVNAATEELLTLLTDANGSVLMPPKAFEDLQKIVSNQLVEDVSDGSDALVFDPRAMVIGIQNNIRIKMITDSDYCLKNGAVGFQIFSMLDCAVCQPKHITKITGIKEQAENNG